MCPICSEPLTIGPHRIQYHLKIRSSGSLKMHLVKPVGTKSQLYPKIRSNYRRIANRLMIVLEYRIPSICALLQNWARSQQSIQVTSFVVVVNLNSDHNQMTKCFSQWRWRWWYSCCEFWKYLPVLGNILPDVSHHRVPDIIRHAEHAEGALRIMKPIHKYLDKISEQGQGAWRKMAHNGCCLEKIAKVWFVKKMMV